MIRKTRTNVFLTCNYISNTTQTYVYWSPLVTTSPPHTQQDTQTHNTHTSHPPPHTHTHTHTPTHTHTHTHTHIFVPFVSAIISGVSQYWVNETPGSVATSPAQFLPFSIRPQLPFLDFQFPSFFGTFLKVSV